jgi:hypothetical protein
VCNWQIIKVHTRTTEYNATCVTPVRMVGRLTHQTGGWSSLWKPPTLKNGSLS